MITYIHNEAKQVGNETYIWFIGNCLSTDYKPTDLVYDNSKLFETDTLKSYVYSAADNAWYEISGGGLGLQEFREIMSHAFAIDNIYMDSHADLSNIRLEHSYEDLEQAVYAAVFMSNGGAVNRFPLYKLFSGVSIVDNAETPVHIAMYGFGEGSISINFIANSRSAPMTFDRVIEPSSSSGSGGLPNIPVGPSV